MCNTIGIAEAIAITMIVTAKNFAMGVSLGQRRWTMLRGIRGAKIKTPRSRSLFGLVREVRGCRLSARHGHLLRLRAVGFLPGSYGVASGRHVLNGEVAAIVVDGIRAFHHDVVAVHPGMNI